MTSYPKSPNTCNFKDCLKHETPKFQPWHYIFVVTTYLGGVNYLKKGDLNL